MSSSAAIDREHLLDWLKEPRRLSAIARHLGLSPSQTRTLLRSMQRDHVVTRVGFGTYAYAKDAKTCGVKCAEPEPEAIMAVLMEPRCAGEIANYLNISRLAAHDGLSRLVRKRAAIRVGYGKYVRSDQADTATRDFKRPQPIRDSIMAFLSEPRTASAIAAHIGRPVPTATGHLAAMRRLGLVVRPRFSTYDRANALRLSDGKTK